MGSGSGRLKNLDPCLTRGRLGWCARALARARGPLHSPIPEGPMSFLAHRRTLTLAAMLAAAALVVAGCSQKSTSVLEPNSPDIAGIKTGGDLSLSNTAVRAVADVQERHTTDLMSVPGVVGTATSVDANGHLAVMVM